MDFEKRAGDVGDAQLVLFQDLAGAIDLIGVQVSYILAPHAANFDPLQAEIVGGHRAGVVEVGGDFVVNDGKAEWAAQQSAHRARQRRQRTRACETGKKFPAR